MLIILEIIEVFDESVDHERTRFAKGAVSVGDDLVKGINGRLLGAMLILLVLHAAVLRMQEGTKSMEEGDMRGEVAQGGMVRSSTGRDRITGEQRGAGRCAAAAKGTTS